MVHRTPKDAVGVFRVEGIVDETKFEGKTYYLVKWKVRATSYSL